MLAPQPWPAVSTWRCIEARATRRAPTTESKKGAPLFHSFAVDTWMKFMSLVGRCCVPDDSFPIFEAVRFVRYRLLLPEREQFELSAALTAAFSPGQSLAKTSSLPISALRVLACLPSAAPLCAQVMVAAISKSDDAVTRTTNGLNCGCRERKNGGSDSNDGQALNRRHELHRAITDLSFDANCAEAMVSWVAGEG